MNPDKSSAYTSVYREAPKCLICAEPLTVKLARGRKSGKPFITLLCPRDGRHFRAFINHQEFVSKLLETNLNVGEPGKSSAGEGRGRGSPSPNNGPGRV